MRVRRWAASLAAAVTLTVASAAVASAAPPPVLPHPPPIAAQFRIHPHSGPTGTSVTIKGLCGSAATTLLYGISTQDAEGFHILWVPTEFPTLTPHPIGVFSVTFTFPSQGNVPVEFGGQGNVAIVPGTYYVGARCQSDVLGPLMPFQPFTVTAGTR